ncbi:hypothetical protein LOK49_Contig109G00001 [Camellia lanceoleosa]|nr:hypothetical protein LOK49_Contig109G00001 [Camellia lanceoleosa]
MTLLVVYEAKWLLRNWAELKSDLEVIVGQISDSNSGTKPVKTPNQCNNEIEAMKKKMYQMESSGIPATAFDGNDFNKEPLSQPVHIDVSDLSF